MKFVNFSIRNGKVIRNSGSGRFEPRKAGPKIVQTLRTLPVVPGGRNCCQIAKAAGVHPMHVYRIEQQAIINFVGLMKERHNIDLLKEWYGPTRHTYIK